MMADDALARKSLADDGAGGIELTSQRVSGLVSPTSFKSLTDLQAHVIAERSAKSGLFGDGTKGAKQDGCRGLAQKVAGSVWFERVVLVLICMNSIAIAVECKEGTSS